MIRLTIADLRLPALLVGLSAIVILLPWRLL